MKMYKKHKLTDEQSDKFVFPHVMAMTKEGLNSKAEIAYELGCRDLKIECLGEQLDAWSKKYADLKIKSDANQWAHDNMQEQLASAPKWISVDEYLPRSANGTWSKRVIGLCDIGLVYSLSYFNSDLEVGGCWQRSNSFVENASKKIVAWMENPHFELLEGKS